MDIGSWGWWIKKQNDMDFKKKGEKGKKKQKVAKTRKSHGDYEKSVFAGTLASRLESRTTFISPQIWRSHSTRRDEQFYDGRS